MSEKETGGPAFPTKSYDLDMDVWVREEGMDLRDYFAAKALQGMCFGDRWPAHNEFNEIAKRAYGLADAMLEARKQ